MTTTQEKEPVLDERIEERPAVVLRKLRDVRPRELGVRFVAGAVTSVAAGLLTLAFGPRVGGIMLAFPAILAASLTLIEKQEDGIEAREDARGAIIGACALALFAAIAALALGHMNGALALLIAAVTWFAGAFLGYIVAWFR